MHACCFMKMRSSLRDIYAAQDLGGINLFILISAASLLYCIPLAYVMESSQWGAAFEAAKLTVGTQGLLQLLAVGGLFYHLYNQVLIPSLLRVLVKIRCTYLIYLSLPLIKLL